MERDACVRLTPAEATGLTLASFIIKALTKLGIEVIHFNITKAIYKKPTANVILNGENSKAFLLIPGTR